MAIAGGLGAALGLGAGALYGLLCGFIGTVLRADWGALLATAGPFALAGLAAGVLAGLVYGVYRADNPVAPPRRPPALHPAALLPRQGLHSSAGNGVRFDPMWRDEP